MISDQYKHQVKLLTQLIPSIFDNEVLAMHGGTAINLFERDMPRLSVDIDLTYIPIQSRKESLQEIKLTLIDVKNNVERLFPEIMVRGPDIIREEAKLICNTKKVQVKIEVNVNMRGLVGEARKMKLCESAQSEFDTYCEARIVSKSQLYGGKIVAALDRQHPRDLFDTQYILQQNSVMQPIKRGLMYAILSSNRPLYVLFDPNLADQKQAFKSQFQGMSTIPFTYEDYEDTRTKLIETIRGSLTEEDKEFLLNFKGGKPDWDVYDFEKYPSVKWKLLNIRQLIKTNQALHDEQLALLQEALDQH